MNRKSKGNLPPRVKPCCFCNTRRAPPAKRPKRWLDDHGISHTARHIKEDNPTADELRAWVDRDGLPIKRFLQHERPCLQKSGPQGQAAHHDRGGADRPAGLGRYAGQAPAAGERMILSCPALSPPIGKTPFITCRGGCLHRPGTLACRNVPGRIWNPPPTCRGRSSAREIPCRERHWMPMSTPTSSA